MSDLLFALTLLSALGCGLVAGVFFAFSSFVMKALARLPAPQGIAAMQSINIAVLNPWFLGLFMGTGVLCIVLAIVSLLAWQTSHSLMLLIGCLIYLFGSIGVTMACNVPRNNSLAAVKPGDGGGDSRWTGYVRSWTAWNHVRAAASLAAAVLLTLAFR